MHFNGASDPQRLGGGRVSQSSGRRQLGSEWADGWRPYKDLHSLSAPCSTRAENAAVGPLSQRAFQAPEAEKLQYPPEICGAIGTFSRTPPGLGTPPLHFLQAERGTYREYIPPMDANST